MALTAEQRSQLHVDIHDYLRSRGPSFAACAAAFLATIDTADYSSSHSRSDALTLTFTTSLEQKWASSLRSEAQDRRENDELGRGGRTTRNHRADHRAGALALNGDVITPLTVKSAPSVYDQETDDEYDNVLEKKEELRIENEKLSHQPDDPKPLNLRAQLHAMLSLNLPPGVSSPIKSSTRKEPMDTSALDQHLAPADFCDRICLVRTNDDASVPVDCEVDAYRLWPALKFASHKELMGDIEANAPSNAVKKFKGLLTAEYFRLSRQRKERTEVDVKAFGIAYLIGIEGRCHLELLSKSEGGEIVTDNRRVFEFHDHIHEMEAGEGTHCGSEKFHSAVKLVMERIEKTTAVMDGQSFASHSPSRAKLEVKAAAKLTVMNKTETMHAAMTNTTMSKPPARGTLRKTSKDDRSSAESLDEAGCGRSVKTVEFSGEGCSGSVSSPEKPSFPDEDDERLELHSEAFSNKNASNSASFQKRIHLSLPAIDRCMSWAEMYCQMRADGWTHIQGSALAEWYYLHPTCKGMKKTDLLRDKEKGVDYFTSEGDLKRYAKQNLGWRAGCVFHRQGRNAVVGIDEERLERERLVERGIEGGRGDSENVAAVAYDEGKDEGNMNITHLMQSDETAEGSPQVRLAGGAMIETMPPPTPGPIDANTRAGKLSSAAPRHSPPIITPTLSRSTGDEHGIMDLKSIPTVPRKKARLHRSRTIIKKPIATNYDGIREDDGINRMVAALPPSGRLRRRIEINDDGSDSSYYSWGGPITDGSFGATHKGGRRGKTEEERRRRVKEMLVEEGVTNADDGGGPICFEGIRIDGFNDATKERYVNHVVQELGGGRPVGNKKYNEDLDYVARAGEGGKKNYRARKHEESVMTRPSSSSLLSPSKKGWQRMLVGRERVRDRGESRDEGCVLSYEGSPLEFPSSAVACGVDPLDLARSLQEADRRPTSSSAFHDIVRTTPQKVKHYVTQTMSNVMDNVLQLGGGSMATRHDKLADAASGRRRNPSMEEKRTSTADAALERRTANKPSDHSLPRREKRKSTHQLESREGRHAPTKRNVMDNVLLDSNRYSAAVFLLGLAHPPSSTDCVDESLPTGKKRKSTQSRTKKAYSLATQLKRNGMRIDNFGEEEEWIDTSTKPRKFAMSCGEDPLGLARSLHEADRRCSL